MEKPKAIRWCFNQLGRWPNSTKFPAPGGWRWIVSNLPYRGPEFKLVNANFEEIRKGDIFDE